MAKNINHFKRVISTLITFFVIAVCVTTSVSAITADDIINKRDDNEYLQSARVESEMIIHKGNRKMTKTMITLIKGNKALTRFTNPRDRGTKYLKRGDELWIFFPEAEDVVNISGHMLNQGMAGSDFSYQDMMESDKLTELYDFKLIGEEEIYNRPCYVLEGTAVEGKEVSYYRRKVWIDKEMYIGLKEKLFARSGRLLKVMNIQKVDKIEGRWYPVKSVMEDKLKKNTKTEFVIKSIKFNPDIATDTFTLENLQ